MKIFLIGSVQSCGEKGGGVGGGGLGAPQQDLHWGKGGKKCKRKLGTQCGRKKRAERKKGTKMKDNPLRNFLPNQSQGEWKKKTGEKKTHLERSCP